MGIMDYKEEKERPFEWYKPPTSDASLLAYDFVKLVQSNMYYLLIVKSPLLEEKNADIQ